MAASNLPVKPGETTSLGRLGRVLPIGLPGGPDGSRLRDFEFKRFRFKEEKLIADLVAKHQAEDSFGKYVTCVLSVLLSRLTGKDLSKEAPESVMVMLSQLPVGDVMYAYAYARVECLGHELVFPEFQCPHCRTKTEGIAADLRDLDVKTGGEESSRVVTLRDGLPYGGKTHRTIRLSTPRWEVFDAPAGETAGPFLAGRTLRLSITGLEHLAEGEPVFVQDESLDELSKADVTALMKAANEVGGGPAMGVSIECPRCHKATGRLFDWGYESFFGTSSR